MDTKYTNTDNTDNKHRELSIYVLFILFYAYHNFIFTIIFNNPNQGKILKSIFDFLTYVWAILIIFKSKDKDLKFGYFLILLFVISTITLLGNQDTVDILTHFNGLRDPLNLICPFVITYYIFNKYDKIIIDKQKKILIIYALINIPLAYYQYTLYGASDGVGGTFTTGGSGYLSQVLFIINFYLVINYADRIDDSHINLKRVMLFILLLLPVTINETKISAVFIGLYFLLLFKGTIKSWKSILIVIFGIIILNIFQILYTASLNENEQVDITDTVYLEKYLFSTDEKGDMSRFGRLEVAYDLVKDDPSKLFFGNGYGIFKGQNILGTVKKADYLLYLYRGSTLFAFEALLQGGLLLVILVFWFIIYNYLRIGNSKIAKLNNLKYYFSIMLLIFGFYNTIYYESFSAFLFAYIFAFLRNRTRAYNEIA